jgi:GNAT superfamily N-acetyltransferase
MAVIRRAEAGDVSGIVEVVNAAFSIESEFRAGDRTSVADVARLVQSDTFLVALEEERIAGAVMVKVNGEVGYFGMLAVAPGMQRSGIGRALLEAAEDHGRRHGCTRMTLKTGSIRPELLTYYANKGYRADRTEPAPQGAPFLKPFDIVWMSKAL